MHVSYDSAPTNGTVAKFRAWGKALFDAIIACGWVQTTDTGQLNWATVAAPSAAKKQMGYVILRSNDSLTPIYLRLGFGSGYNASEPCVWVQIGTGTNGAGALTGAISTPLQMCIYGYQANDSLMPCWVSGDAGRLLFVLWIEGDWYRHIFCAIERTTDATGARTSEGASVWTCSAGGTFGTTGYIDTAYSQTLNFAMQQLKAQPHWNAVIPPTGNGAILNNTYPFPVRSWFAGEGPASLQLFMYCVGDLPTMSPIVATLWDGSSHKILPLGGSKESMRYGGSGHIAIRVD